MASRRKSSRSRKRKDSPYRLELLPRVPAYARKARRKQEFETGQLVYYGPTPQYYGIGEVKWTTDAFVAVDFRGTGAFRVHQQTFEPQYLMPVPETAMQQL